MDPAVRAAHLVILFVGRDAAWQRADEVGTVTSVRGNEFGGGVVGVPAVAGLQGLVEEGSGVGGRGRREGEQMVVAVRGRELRGEVRRNPR